MSAKLPGFQYRGARALVALHEEQIRLFLGAWKRAKASGGGLPDVDDPDYASYDALLRHVFRWARGYLRWICKNLDLPDPEVRQVPEADVIESEYGSYVEHLLEKWNHPLRDVSQDRIFKEVYTAPWKVPLSIEAMLEHAVMHPLRHRFQLEELMGER